MNVNIYYQDTLGFGVMSKEVRTLDKQTGKRLKTEDGRVRRGSNSRQKIIMAALDLVESGSLCVSAQRVAEHAGVGLRSVFRHFSDMESLFFESNVALFSRFRPLFVSQDLLQNLPLEGRVSAFIERRVNGFYVIKNFVRFTETQFYEHPILRKQYIDLSEDFEANAILYLPEINLLDEVDKAIVLSLLSYQYWDLQERIRGLNHASILTQTQHGVLQILVHKEGKS